MRRESGVQVTTRLSLPLGDASKVRRLAVPPEAGRTYTSKVPARRAVKAIQRPSGEKRGNSTAPGSRVRRLAAPPARGAVQRSPWATNAIAVADAFG